jgi:hypothetical protein
MSYSIWAARTTQCTVYFILITEYHKRSGLYNNAVTDWLPCNCVTLIQSRRFVSTCLLCQAMFADPCLSLQKLKH